MTERGSFYRKITYLVLIAVLLFPISQLGAPATQADLGGVLAQMRVEYELGQSNLGDIDPASETIRLATLGLRGVAVSMLWHKSNEYKKKKDWTNYSATLDQLSKLQPYFVSFWRYQAWNLSYNVSVEVDDVRDRYYHVIQGIKFLEKGATYIRYSPYLLTSLGWFTGNKIGTADEKVQYRRLFKADDDYHPADRRLEQRDNWLVSRGFNEAAVSAVDDKKRSLGQKNPTVFYAAPARSQINYSVAIEREGSFGERAKTAWTTASRLWRDFGNRTLRASTGIEIRLSDYERLEEEVDGLIAELEALVPDPREQLLAKRRAEFSALELELVDSSGEGLSSEQYEIHTEAIEKLEIDPQDIVEFIAEKYPEKSIAVRRLAYRISDAHERQFFTRNNLGVANYEYWDSRCLLEQKDEALKARELAYAANRAFRDDGDLLEARRMYEESFALWAQLYANNQKLKWDSPSASDLTDEVEKYVRVLEQLELSLKDEEVASKFPLWNMLEANNSGQFSAAIEQYHRRWAAPEESNDPLQGIPRLPE
jgi:hypothetical protein